MKRSEPADGFDESQIAKHQKSDDGGDAATATSHMSAADALGAKMKSYESAWDLSLVQSQPYVVRLDGRSFSTFSRKYCVQPFDERFTYAMRKTTEDLVREFSPVSGYVQSDEITLVFLAAPKNTKTGEYGNHMFSGRVSKIVSVLAAAASVVFNRHISPVFEKASVPELERPVLQFDARAFSVPDEGEAYQAVRWRCAFDCVRHSKTKWAGELLGHKKLFGMTSQAAIELAAEKTGQKWEDLEEHVKYGYLVKRGKVKKEGVNGKTGKKIEYTRTEVEARALPEVVRTDKEEGRKVLASKMWDEA